MMVVATAGAVPQRRRRRHPSRASASAYLLIVLLWNLVTFSAIAQKAAESDRRIDAIKGVRTRGFEDTVSNIGINPHADRQLKKGTKEESQEDAIQLNNNIFSKQQDGPTSTDATLKISTTVSTSSPGTAETTSTSSTTVPGAINRPPVVDASSDDDVIHNQDQAGENIMKPPTKDSSGDTGPPTSDTDMIESNENNYGSSGKRTANATTGSKGVITNKGKLPKKAKSSSRRRSNKLIRPQSIHAKKRTSADELGHKKGYVPSSTPTQSLPILLGPSPRPTKTPFPAPVSIPAPFMPTPAPVPNTLRPTAKPTLNSYWYIPPTPKPTGNNYWMIPGNSNSNAPAPAPTVNP